MADGRITDLFHANPDSFGVLASKGVKAHPCAVSLVIENLEKIHSSPIREILNMSSSAANVTSKSGVLEIAVGNRQRAGQDYIHCQKDCRNKICTKFIRDYDNFSRLNPAEMERRKMERSANNTWDEDVERHISDLQSETETLRRLVADLEKQIEHLREKVRRMTQ